MFITDRCYPLRAHRCRRRRVGRRACASCLAPSPRYRHHRHHRPTTAQLRRRQRRRRRRRAWAPSGRASSATRTPAAPQNPVRWAAGPRGMQREYRGSRRRARARSFWPAPPCSACRVSCRPVAVMPTTLPNANTRSSSVSAHEWLLPVVMRTTRIPYSAPTTGCGVVASPVCPRPVSGTRLSGPLLLTWPWPSWPWALLPTALSWSSAASSRRELHRRPPPSARACRRAASRPARPSAQRWRRQRQGGCSGRSSCYPAD